MAGVKAYKLGEAGCPAYPDDFEVVQKAVLQVTDIKTNRNKYYAIELHAAQEGAKGSFRVFTHYGRTDDLETNPDAGASPFTGSLKTTISPKLGDTTVQVGAQGFVGAPVPKDGSLMSKAPQLTFPTSTLPTYTPLGNGVFFTITIPTEGTGKRK